MTVRRAWRRGPFGDVAHPSTAHRRSDVLIESLLLPCSPVVTVFSHKHEAGYVYSVRHVRLVLSTVDSVDLVIPLPV